MLLRNSICIMTTGVMLILLAGCAAIGPPRMKKDRINYNLSLADSWKRQILLNIIKIRYVEPIFFLDVGEIVTAYSMETGGNVGASRSIFDSGSSLFSMGAAVKYTDRPTTTYRPLTGLPFFRGVMSPMPLRNVLMSIESGASAEFFLTLGVRSINGLCNEMLTSNGYRVADPRFVRVVKLLAKLQALNALHIVREPLQPHRPPLLRLIFGGSGDDAVTAAYVTELKELLRLDARPKSYRLGFGSIYADDHSIMLQTYSLAQVLATVSGRVNMPAEDLISHRVVAATPATANKGLFKSVMVHSAKDKPEDSFASIQYRDSWFWIDDHDLLTKKVFSFLMLAFTLMDKGQQESQLQLTIPTQ
ncbi:hypothetical protein [Maridesulfovibrio hydrothermalis]|uniref:Uncharacterized protein n=1 Tax=Maridesulfovibrio hydrothermalis AM13 = DSM 14728 TaxID=1121451 RepID=L0RD70_9BACT|nr:hypothetical protein [Maridesulfovibrio hydrothermalis]CCO24172.1 conserved exported protein of unknown function [Maridesulfovibrio hydrothermalis AM13 = DSM 14728]